MPRSVMGHSFANVPTANIPRSSFDLSKGLKTTFDADYLIPVYWQEVIPSSSYNVNGVGVIRLNSPTLHPLMDNMYCDVHYFFVAYRLIWDNWDKMHGAQDNPGDSIAYTVPVTGGSSSTVGDTDLAAYFGIPPGLDLSVDQVNTLWFRAYRFIFDEWYRNQNLQNSETFATDDGPDSNGEAGYYDNPLKRGKRYDYFTAALPSPQKGTAVDIDIGTAPVKTAAGHGQNIGIYSTNHSAYKLMDSGAATVDVSTTITDAETNRMYVDSATGFTVNDLRLAFQTQRLLERDARSGTRYREHLMAHFRADNNDLRLQRPEFLGGGTVPIQINSVPNTSEDAAQKQGELTGYGIGTGRFGFTKSFTEWGVILGIASVRSDLTYSQGIERFWHKSTRYDYPYPVLAHIGEQAVLDKEIWYSPANADGMNDDVWGYMPRYEEYRHGQTRLTGLMHPDATGTLASWHLSEDFSTRPSLDSTFIQGNTTTPLDRAIAIPSEPQFNADFYHRVRAALPLPTYGVPGNLDHF